MPFDKVRKLVGSRDWEGGLKKRSACKGGEKEFQGTVQMIFQDRK